MTTFTTMATQYNEKKQGSQAESTKENHVLVIHGGAGVVLKEGSTPEQQLEYKRALGAALRAGYAILKKGGEAMDAAVAAVRVMENDPLFNAGKGAVFNSAGKNELEASIMLSKPPSSHPTIPATRRGAALTLLTRAKNPAQLARAIYLNPSSVPHVFLSGAPAEVIGENLGETLVDSSYFFTGRRWREHRRALGLPEEPFPPHLDGGEKEDENDLLPKGTVGAVALDIRGCIAAVTSTGGRTNKIPGRIGDTPLMGAGFWAEEWTHSTTGWVSNRLATLGLASTTGKRAVGVSGTGDGDFFIRQATASTIASRMKLANETVEQASKWATEDLREVGGLGGVIALDNEGNVAMTLNTNGMFRGVVRSDGVPRVAIFEDDNLEEI
ncbi:N-terminal nucleophile aminohydrolase [Coprinopsis marcescibilis]|uniref:N-terminal nucleophile aminohydrolase n=1 Tax=Coprinopsis marcescibilis TaxID=230819 RepID=A0A5C3KTH6_COPMA|nr:N-terminal nucleophile aminohydrolase [Coprinopsis marcescibilis]